MKTIKILVFFALAVMCSFSSCHTGDPVLVTYTFGLSFQDATGNDLVKGIESDKWWPTDFTEEDAHTGMVKSDLYTLDIIVSKECNNWDNEIYNAPARPGFTPSPNYPLLGWMRMENGYYCFITGLTLQLGDCPNVETLTLKLKCPYVFGDDEIHEFVTYWNLPKKYSSFPECTRITIDGIEISKIKNRDDDNRYIALIILEK